MAEVTIKIVLGIMLLISSVQDARKKKILLWVIAACGLLVGICLPFGDRFSFFDTLGGIAVGGSVVVISLATGGKIGMGDGLLLCVTGVGMGFWGNLELFGIALFLAAVISIILLIFRLADRKKSIPFVPFLFAAYLFLTVVDIYPGFLGT